MIPEKLVLMAAVILAACALAAAAEGPWTTWPPRKYLLDSLLKAVPDYLRSYDPKTGRFGTKPWTCRDQNVIYPLAAAWSIEDPANPHHHSDRVLAAIARGGGALVEAMDSRGQWVFRKKDNSTWGRVHMPWTYSRWVRAYALVGEALPDAARKKWEKGLRLGYGHIRGRMRGGVHNIPAHHAMGLYVAGQSFENEAWRTSAAGYMAKVVGKQDAAGFWSEHHGPVVTYNRAYVEALGVYYGASRDRRVLPALRRAAKFHAAILYPDGSAASVIDERVVYQDRVDVGNAGFSWTAEGRGFLLRQLSRHSEGGRKPIGGDYAADMLLYGGTGEGAPVATGTGPGATWIGRRGALIRRAKPWQWVLSGYACRPVAIRWIQDRQSFVEVYHNDLGVVLGGGNTKCQPYWSTFTVGDPALLSHKQGRRSPNFVPKIALRWTPDKAALADGDGGSTVALRYGPVACKVAVEARDDGGLALTCTAPAGKAVEGHLPFLKRADELRTAAGRTVTLTEKDLRLDAEAIGGWFVHAGLKVTVPAGASLRWPAWQFNPYAKGGVSSLDNAKLVLVLPFEKAGRHQVVLTKAPASRGR